MTKTKRCIDKAISPINHARITAGYKNPSYENEMGFRHYGTDMTDRNRKDLKIYAPCPIKIIDCGFDPLMGGSIIAVSVNEVDVHYGPKKGARRLAFRFAHLDKIHVKKGQIIGPEGAPLGLYGGTGRYGGGNAARHLHIEVSTDVKYPAYSPALKGSSTIWKAGKTDATINPMDVFKIDRNGDLGLKQTFGYRGASGSWILAGDKQTVDLDGKVIDATRWV